jgi:hypothetical protein
VIEEMLKLPRKERGRIKRVSPCVAIGDRSQIEDQFSKALAAAGRLPRKPIAAGVSGALTLDPSAKRPNMVAGMAKATAAAISTVELFRARAAGMRAGGLDARCSLPARFPNAGASMRWDTGIETAGRSLMVLPFFMGESFARER